MPYSLTLTQKLTMMQNRWTVTRTDSTPVDMGYITQKRMALKESVTCTTPDGAGVVFRIQGRKVIELGGVYDVVDGDGSKPFGQLSSLSSVPAACAHK